MNAVLFEEEQAVIHQRRGASSTEYQITGSLHSVLVMIEKLFGEYHPSGYGTYVHSIGLGDAGNYNARVSHSNSCD